MRKSILLLFGLSLAFSCKRPTETTEAQRVDTVATPAEPAETLVGAWEEVAIDQAVEDAAKFAAENIDPEFYLQKILSAKRQVVKGYNYDLTFTLENGETWNAIVYRDLDGKYSITQKSLLPKE